MSLKSKKEEISIRETWFGPKLAIRTQTIKCRGPEENKISYESCSVRSQNNIGFKPFLVPFGMCGYE